MLKTSWTPEVTNQEVLNTIHEEMINNIHQRKHKWIGHVQRHDGLLHTITMGKIKEREEEDRKDNI